MSHSIEATGKSIDEAIQSALRTLGTDRDSVTVEVLEKPKSGFLGLGSTPARVRVTLLADMDAEPDLPAKASLAAQKPKETRKAEKLPAAKPAPKPVTLPAAESPARAAPLSKPVSAPEKKPQAARTRYTPEKDGSRPRRRYDEVQEPVEEDRVNIAKGFLAETLRKMGIEDAVIKSSQEERYLLLDVTGSNMGRLIGRRGDTLDAVQRLVSHAVNRNAERHVRLVVDTEQYRQKREESLITLAKRSAERALKQRRNVPLEPMNSYARHVIHAALQDFPGVSTHSVGMEPNRRVIVAVPEGDKRPHRGSRPPRGR